MAGSKFQYDESGGTFFYFILSFLALVVIPCTYYFWPKEEKKEEVVGKKKKCHCEQCGIKSNNIRAKEPWKKAKQRAIKTLLILGWIALFACAYKVAHLQHDYVNYDPFEILGIDPAASSREIKKAYHKLSLLYHPDKETGDERKFLMISKAYAALTDEESRKNWELYGNPDGPGATSFGIALPSWIVEKENSFIVLGLYALVFMIALPTLVGIWWYNSVKYGGDQVLLDTTQLFYCFIHKSPHMVLKRVIMIIAASLEFEKSHNSEVVERPTDNVEVPALIRNLQSESSNLNEKNKERPLCYHYSIKARALLYAHLYRMKLPPSTLDLDRQFILKKCPNLIHEFVQCVAQLTMLAIAGRIPRCPSLDTLESAMKLSPLIIQAIWDSRSLFFQLPHFTDDLLKLFSHKKFNIRSLDQFAKMNNNDRRTMLRSLTDDQYDDILLVLSDMPLIHLSVKTEVLDDEDSGVITAGAIVTVTATLKRLTYGSLYGILSDTSTNGSILIGSADRGDRDDENEPFLANGSSLQNSLQTNSKPVWQKRDKGKKKKGKGNAKVQNKSKQIVQTQSSKVSKVDTSDQTQSSKVSKVDASDQTQSSKVSKVDTSDQTQSSKVSKVDTSDVSDRESGQESENESESGLSGDESPIKGSGGSDGEEGTGRSGTDDELEEKDWSRINRKSKKSKVLDGSSRISHTVHCPYFPEEKQEYWWIYVSDKKKHSLTTVPVLMTNLLSEESVDLKFTAPNKPGIYSYTVIARSDSYVDCVKEEVIKIDVHEAKIVVDHPQWEISDHEDQNEEEAEESAVSDPDLVDSSDEDDGQGLPDSDLDASSDD